MINTKMINLGCGDQCLDGYIGLDILIRKGTNVVSDLEKPLPFATDSVNMIYAKSVLEHIDNLEEILQEVDRILSHSGKFYVYVPHWSNPFHYSDYTHKRFFGLATFDYFSDIKDQKYKFIQPYSSTRFKTLQIRLLFKSPFRLLHISMKILQWFINRNNTLKLFYEYHLSSFFPCYAIEYILRKKDA
jgi:SAM-dependent methyltransferase